DDRSDAVEEPVGTRRDEVLLEDELEGVGERMQEAREADLEAEELDARAAGPDAILDHRALTPLGPDEPRSEQPDDESQHQEDLQERGEDEQTGVHHAGAPSPLSRSDSALSRAAWWSARSSVRASLEASFATTAAAANTPGAAGTTRSNRRTSPARLMKLPSCSKWVATGR